MHFQKKSSKMSSFLKMKWIKPEIQSLQLTNEEHSLKTDSFSREKKEIYDLV